MSTISEEGVSEVKQEACEILLAYRVESKIATKKVDGILNRLHVAFPKARDEKERPPCIPDVIRARKPDYYNYDVIPEFWEGHNVADFIDPKIFKKLEQLEKEDSTREEAGFYAVPKIELDQTLKDIRALAQQIRDKKILMKQESNIIQASTKPKLPRTATPKVRERSVSRLRTEMGALGVDIGDENKAGFKRTRGQSRSLSHGGKKIRLGSCSMSRPPRGGKSSFINKISRADVEVQPYALPQNLCMLVTLTTNTCVGK